jgi:ANTAR domain/GAF domain
VTAAADDNLAEVFADIARQLHEQGSPEAVVDRITRAAVDTVEGCDHAAISILRRHGRIETRGATDDVPTAVDAIQYEVGQGPCLDAMDEHEVFQIDDLATDERWPPFSRRAADETGVRSMLSFRLFVEADTIDEQARSVGTILATHAALALRSAQDKERAEQLDQAVASNRVIGMAMGVLMARGRMTEQEAFSVLSRASQHLNRRLRDVASAVVETGLVPDRPQRPARG